ncbi:MAG: N-acetylmuramoyl-L-alanine amidase [Acidobacteria bacterium]|nr:N-acetylmuramoyl-L-alanine amidase [Acidobacteriota bacterium]
MRSGRRPASSWTSPARPEPRPPPRPPRRSRRPPPRTNEDDRRRPGHGGTEEGAKGPGGSLREDATLALARTVVETLQRRGYRVLMTGRRMRPWGSTTGPPPRTPRRRTSSSPSTATRRARPPRTARRSTTCRSTRPTARRPRSPRARTAPRPGRPAREERRGARPRPHPLGLAQNQHLGASARLAEIVQADFNRLLGITTRGVKQAPFRVLIGVNAPAVLVEVSFITDPDEEKKINSEEFRRQGRGHARGQPRDVLPVRRRRRARAVRAEERQELSPVARRFALALVAILALLLGAFVVMRSVRSPKAGAPPAPAPRPTAVVPPTPIPARNVTLFFESKEGDGMLHPEARDVPVAADDVAFLRAVASGVVEGPRSADLVKPFPEGWTLRGAYLLRDGVAVLDVAPPALVKWQAGAHEEDAAVQALAVTVRQEHGGRDARRLPRGGGARRDARARTWTSRTRSRRTYARAARERRPAQTAAGGDTDAGSDAHGDVDAGAATPKPAGPPAKPKGKRRERRTEPSASSTRVWAG